MKETLIMKKYKTVNISAKYRNATFWIWGQKKNEAL